MLVGRMVLAAGRSHCGPRITYSTAAQLQEKPKKTKFGPLSDQDRIFTNLYADDDIYIDGALKRGGTLLQKD